MLPIEIREYVDHCGRSPFGRWRSELDEVARQRIVRALARLSFGVTSNLKGVGEGISELKVDFGPGYRVYFGWDGKVLVILLGGGTKKRQQNDIAIARDRWRDYQARKQRSE